LLRRRRPPCPPSSRPKQHTRMSRACVAEASWTRETGLGHPLPPPPRRRRSGVHSRSMATRRSRMVDRRWARAAGRAVGSSTTDAVSVEVDGAAVAPSGDGVSTTARRPAAKAFHAHRGMTTGQQPHQVAGWPQGGMVVVVVVSGRRAAGPAAGVGVVGVHRDRTLASLPSYRRLRAASAAFLFVERGVGGMGDTGAEGGSADCGGSGGPLEIPALAGLARAASPRGIVCVWWLESVYLSCPQRIGRGRACARAQAAPEKLSVASASPDLLSPRSVTHAPALIDPPFKPLPPRPQTRAPRAPS